MKNFKTLLITTAAIFAFNVSAHDPSMHAKKAPAKADCSGYLKMVESGTKMDMSDPVMMAMMKKCKNQKPESKHDNADGHHGEKSEKKCGDMAATKHADSSTDTGDKKCGDKSDGHHDKKSEKKCDGMKDSDAMKKSEGKCGDKKAADNKEKTEMKCGGDMKKGTKKVEKKIEEHGKHDH